MSKPRFPNILKRISTNLLLVLATIVITLAIAEIVLRFTPYKHIGARDYTYPSNYFTADAEIGYDIIKNSKGAKHAFLEHPYELFSNSYGCFDYERAVPDDYGLIVGDSYTWGYTPLEKKWTTYVEEKSGMFMMKCGITGHGTMQEMRKAKRVIKAVGKNPKLIIVLYTSNDFNDDFMFPNRTTIGDGVLVNKNKGANLVTGERFYYSDDELEERNKKYLGHNLNSYLYNFGYSLVTYRLFINAIPKIKIIRDKIFASKTQNSETKVATANKMPDYTPGYYTINLTDFFDQTNRLWYNKAIEDHKKNIKDFAIYAKSIGAKFVFIDSYGVLSHKRFDDLRQFFDNNQNMYFYNLRSDYPTQSTWKYDGHWNIQGNQESGKYIYQHLKELGVFDSH